jgi:hypothetical protein
VIQVKSRRKPISVVGHLERLFVQARSIQRKASGPDEQGLHVQQTSRSI